ncbi:hypothetical protein [Sinanaerobacter sp. ZZT-01]|uniref:hypothetical protein n=1 Tax=Sinanaerobacter sp. ZZT-01 TaxID=3111540 RepID=UPI002D793CD5|nr:hypothetical protein [Sinanaerobacter sp. ZZT-01]WRR93496.1 hypothetical protein U5921_15920 [Sinanaerobacter sp. ZZT-01]
MDCFKIGIISIEKHSGVSFLTTVLAAYFAEQKKFVPAVLELGTPSLYYSLGIEKYFLGRGFTSVFEEESKQEDTKEIQNLHKGINWALQTPSDYQREYNFINKFRLIHNVYGDLLLCDFSGCKIGMTREGGNSGNQGVVCDENWQLLREMDCIFLVIDPLPSKLLSGAEQLAHYRLSRLPIRIVINKDNSGVPHKELQNYLQTKDLICIPYLQPEWLYEAEYKCLEPYAVDEVKHALKEPIGELESVLGANRFKNSLFRQDEIHRNIPGFKWNPF